VPEETAERKQKEQGQEQDVATRDQEDHCGQQESEQDKSHGKAPLQEEWEDL
jgi:hypothetical protein